MQFGQRYRSVLRLGSAVLLVVVMVLAGYAVWRNMPARQSHTLSVNNRAVVGSADNGGRDADAPTRSAAVRLSEEPLSALVLDDARLAAERRRYRTLLERRHRQEPVDIVWSSDAEKAIAAIASREDLAAAGLVPDALQIACHSITCRISAQFAEVGVAQDWSNFFITGTGSTLSQAELFIEPATNGSVEVSIIGTRPSP